MAGSYNLRSRDQDASSYATLPGTSNAAFVPHNMTPLKNNLMSDREVPGCHPSRWIYELVNNDFSVCDMFERARSAKLDSTYAWDHPHRLVINGKQTCTVSSSRILSTICLDCHFHFVFNLVWSEAHAHVLCSPNQSRWPLQDDQFPWHHLVWVGSLNGKEITTRQSKYYPLLARENFVCSAPPCTFQVTLEVSEPRMPTSWVQLLLDRDAIAEQLKRAKELQPVRYELASDDWVDQAPQNLNTYLKNLLETNPDEARSIAKRNKRFSVLFGPRCFSIFRQLEFREEVKMDDAGVDEGVFIPSPPAPAAGPDGTTELMTYRAYLEDVRAEVQCLIHRAGHPMVEKPTFCSPALHALLGCQEVLMAGDSALVNTQRYRILGILPNQPREVVVNAYKRQWDLVPNQRRLLVESLMAVANDACDELLSEYAITQSSVFDSQLQRQGSGDDDGVMTQALDFLGLQPPNNYSAQSIIDAFRGKLARDPADAGTARNMLMLIAQASTDDGYQTALLLESDSSMTLPTARAILGLGPSEVPWQTAVEVAKRRLESSKAVEESNLYLDALDAVADHTNSAALKQAVLELRQTMGTLAGDFRAVAGAQPADLTLPVGLHNIGNTCYLNSLLQYLFTVKPIRDTVLNYDDSRLDLTDEAIKARLLGGNKMQMDRGEAVVAQAFVRELATLFQNLRSSDQAATRPTQRLANAVLLSTHTLLHSPKQPEEQPAATAEPPPLPARPSPAPPANAASGDVDMVSCSVTSVPESLDGSNSSSKTLVDQEDARSDHSYDKVETMAAMESVALPAVAEDVEMPDADRDVSARLDTAREAGGATVPGSGEAETVDQKVLNALEHQKRSSGTDQQDVEEVMGSIINRLQAAIRPSSVDKRTGIQLEKIMQTFFVTTVNYTKKFDDKTYQHEISFDRSITAFPAPDGPCSLYDALGRNFDQQMLEESKLSRYTAIKTLPPVLHVLIQRSQSMGSKNGNPVIIPETLHLDRYMDAPHDSPVFRRRVQDWTLTDRIADLKSWLSQGEIDSTYLTFFDSLTRTDKGGRTGGDDAEECVGDGAVAEERWDFDGPVDDDFLLITSADSREAPKPRVKEAAGVKEAGRSMHVGAMQTQIREMMEQELAEREQALQQHLDGMKSISYRLHAVICHRGHLMSGHYWVWIRDFEDQVWRWYNDADVRENKNTAEVLQTLSTSGEPYYLCYVRDEDKQDYVNVPKRKRAGPLAEDDVPVTTDEDGDVCVVDAAHSTRTAADENGSASSGNYRIE
ncbi:hypothetical protein XA68_14761 [Ophiocordyceps unilateralis]|uniref:ubiquitinyl hydrolase 1 n=1 Tax=Ophiocordyceps unilateralis TaxID=268505 RepID=A0A2A9P9Y1_OPHUN|nr:hypothetical protein XA68_14761 [Ophiocordyceps unilateralis]